MRKISIPLLGLLFSSLSVSAQPKQKIVTKQDTQPLKTILIGCGLPFKIVNDSLAVIPYGGENIPSFQVFIQKASDLYIIYTNLSESLPGKIDETTFKYLLQRNDHFDIVKLCLGTDNLVYVRADVYRSSVNTLLLSRIIRQVANVTNIIGGDVAAAK
ncbi:MAG: hypothetical protein H7Y27_14270 [Gemmatimonadaceae bacterium]|nr:hypothetical protein [Chitinophagaceae bacterium]